MYLWRGVFACGCAVLVFIALSSTAEAGFTEFFGEDLSPGGTVPPAGNANTARNQFLGLLSGVGTEDFESFASLTYPPLNLSFPGSTGSITATLTGGGFTVTGTGAGRFPTSGNALFNVDPGQGAFEIDFSSPIAAFGFFGTDIGDIGGQITLELTDGSTKNVTIPNTVGAPDGALLFYGFVDTADSYTKITFGNTSGYDGFGYDDMTVGDVQQIVPEPSSLAVWSLVGLSFLGIGWWRRRKAA